MLMIFAFNWSTLGQCVWIHCRVLYKSKPVKGFKIKFWAFQSIQSSSVEDRHYGSTLVLFIFHREWRIKNWNVKWTVILIRQIICFKIFFLLYCIKQRRLSSKNNFLCQLNVLSQNENVSTHYSLHLLNICKLLQKLYGGKKNTFKVSRDSNLSNNV